MNKYFRDITIHFAKIKLNISSNFFDNIKLIFSFQHHAYNNTCRKEKQLNLSYGRDEIWVTPHFPTKLMLK